MQIIFLVGAKTPGLGEHSELAKMFGSEKKNKKLAFNRTNSYRAHYHINEKAEFCSWSHAQRLTFKLALFHLMLVFSWPELFVYVCVCLTFAGGEIKGDKPHISAARATTGKAEKWVIYMPTEQLGSNLHASCSAFQPRQQIKSERKGGVGGGILA